MTNWLTLPLKTVPQLGMLNIWFGYVGGRGTNIAPRWDTAASVVPVAV